jgi:hypothetical protein
MLMSSGRFSVRALRNCTILSPFQILTRRLVQEVAQDILAPQVTAAPDHAAGKIHGEIHPG